MKLSDLLHALRWLGVEEAEDIEKTPIRSVIIERDSMIVLSLSKDGEGNVFPSHENELATNRRIYKIEVDL